MYILPVTMCRDDNVIHEHSERQDKIVLHLDDGVRTDILWFSIESPPLSNILQFPLKMLSISLMHTHLNDRQVSQNASIK